MTAAAAVPAVQENHEERRAQYATAIDEANQGKIVEYFDNGWRVGTMITFRPESKNCSIMPLGKQAGAKIIPLEDVRVWGSKPVVAALKESLQPKAKAKQQKKAAPAPVAAQPAAPAPATQPDKPAAAPEGQKPASKPAKAKTTPKQAKEKPAPKAKAEKPGGPERPTSPLHEIELLPYSGQDSRDCFFGKLRGKRVVIVYHDRNRQDASKRFNSITLREARIKDAQHVAKAEGLELWFAVQVTVAGRWDQGYAVPLALAKEYATGGKEEGAWGDFSLGVAARTAYHADKSALVGVRFNIAKTAK